MRARTGFRWLFVMSIGAFAIVAFEAACTKDTGGGTGTTGEPGPTPTAPTTNKAPEGAATGPTSQFGVPLSANKCPSAVPGSTTTVKELPDGVEVTVTAPGGSPINDIRQRGVQIVAAAKDPATGGGSAEDGLAKCPVVVKGMIVSETDVPGGAAFTVKPISATNLVELKKDTKARASSYVIPQ